MGIKGLHKALSFCTKKDNLRNYRNEIVAVDTSSWMHKSVYSISEKFVEATDAGHVDKGCVRVSAKYIITRCKELIEAFGIRAVYLVIDGKRIPMKADETHDRDQKRKDNLAEARRLKRCGERYKAEDKYKSCIRIKDPFTHAVIREVEMAFSSYGRVFTVNSPHEADSQLTRLVLDGVANAVITEDSDVLVYSAAAHKAFPILFKLDRQTGDCDKINMDWLISPCERETNKVVKSKNTLEFILRRFASKQLKTPGLGVRLFVQGCILSGCDYVKNIEGIGMTNAFKMVSENAFRSPSDRFRKILESLPKKVRQKIDIREHEEILSKSEAIFFYHPVLHKDRQVKPLLPPRLSADNDTDGFANFFPVMSRFGGDWSFMGKSETSLKSTSSWMESPDESSARKDLVLKAESVKETSSIHTKKREAPQEPLPNQTPMFHNPYKKHKKESTTNGSLPLRERSININRNRGGINSQQKRDEKNPRGIAKYFSKVDPRYAQRSFPPTSSTKTTTKRPSLASSSFRLSSRSLSSKKSVAQFFFEKRATKKKITNGRSPDSRSNVGNSVTLCHTKGMADMNSFAYPTYSELDKSESTRRRPKLENLFNRFKYDDEESVDEIEDSPTVKSMQSKDSIENDTSTSREQDVSLKTMSDSNGIGNTAIYSSPIDPNRINHEQNSNPVVEAVTTSHYFRKKRSDPRRVTMDSSTKPPELELIESKAGGHPGIVQPSDDDEISSPETNKRPPKETGWHHDECIDDPDDDDTPVKTKGLSLQNAIATRTTGATLIGQKNDTTTSQSTSRGSITAYFKRHKNPAKTIEKNAQSQPNVCTNAFFSPSRYSKSTRHSNSSIDTGAVFYNDFSAQGTSFSRLKLNSSRPQSSEDYLWDDTP